MKASIDVIEILQQNSESAMLIKYFPHVVIKELEIFTIFTIFTILTILAIYTMLTMLTILTILIILIILTLIKTKATFTSS